MDRIAEFRRWKAQCLSKADLSRKGSVDEDVVEVVQLLNGREQFFTTSSCAGRIVLLDGVRPLEPVPCPPGSVQRQGPRAHAVQHPLPARLSFWLVVSVYLRNLEDELDQCFLILMCLLIT